jgi:tetratricopeptide (TPR) repeat protein
MTSWGIAALKRGDFQVAEGRLDRAREVTGDRPLPPLWYWARSLAAAGQESFEEAERILSEGLTHHPRHPILLNNLAVLAELVGETERAEESLRTALADEPAIPQLSKNLGDLLYRAGRYDEAATAYARAVKLQPDLGDDVYFKLGNIAYRGGDREHAAAHWQHVLELNPGHELARTNLDTLSALR